MPKIIVGCKLPNGLVMEMGKVGHADYKSVALVGSNGLSAPGGYGLTDNVDEAFFDAWMEKHKDLDFVRQKLLFKEEKREDATAHAIDESERKTGFERLTNKDLPKKVEEDKEQMARVRAAGRRVA